MSAIGFAARNSNRAFQATVRGLAATIHQARGAGRWLSDAATRSAVSGSRIASNWLERVRELAERVPIRGSGDGMVHTWGRKAGAIRLPGRAARATERTSVQLTVKEPRILSNPNLTSAERAYLQKQFAVKRSAVSRAAGRGELKWSPGTNDVRIGELQRKYREAVAARFKRRYGRELPLDALNADHPVDLIVGGSARQQLKLADESINKSIGAALFQAGRKAGLNAGDIIDEVVFVGR